MVCEVAAANDHIAQFNFGRMRWPAEDPRMAGFVGALDQVFALADTARGFVRRIDDAEIARGLAAAGFDPRTSATVSVWRDLESLRSYTFDTVHGTHLTRAAEWFEKSASPQLVIWPCAENSHPNVREALARLDDLRQYGPSERAFGWDGPGRQ